MGERAKLRDKIKRMSSAARHRIEDLYQNFPSLVPSRLYLIVIIPDSASSAYSSAHGISDPPRFYYASELTESKRVESRQECSFSPGGKTCNKQPRRELSLKLKLRKSCMIDSLPGHEGYKKKSGRRP